MKGSKFIFGAFLTIALSVGVGVGLGAQKQAKKADADGGTLVSKVLYCAISTETLGTYTLKVNSMYENNNQEYWYQETMVDLNDTTTFPGMKVFTGTFKQMWDGINRIQFQLYDGEEHKGQKEPVAAWDTTNYEGKLYNYSTETWSSGYVPPAGTYRTVTKLAVEFVGGVAQEPADWGIKSDSVLNGNPYAVPSAAPDKNLEHFVGWYDDAACETALQDIASLTADKTIYAKYERLAEDSYIYWVSQSETPVFDHVSFWGEKQGNYELDDFDITGSVKFNGLQQKIYKMSIPSDGSFGFAFYEGDWATQTYDITPTPGAAYYTWLKEGESKYSWNANANAGLALDLVYAVAEKMEAVVASGTILAGSVCGIAPADAAKLYNDYLALATHGDAQTMAGNSFINTYDREDSSKTAYVGVSVIMQQLRAIAVKGGQTVNDAYRLANSQATANTSVVVIIAITSVSALALGVFLVLKRKKQD